MYAVKEKLKEYHKQASRLLCYTIKVSLGGLFMGKTRAGTESAERRVLSWDLMRQHNASSFSIKVLRGVD